MSNGVYVTMHGSGGGGASNTAWVSTIPASPFDTHTPKEESIKAVKLTIENMKDVAADILTKVGGKVNVVTNIAEYTALGFTMPVLTIGDDAIFNPGEYIVEEYDYVVNKPVFRKASVADRQRFDLR